MKLSRRRLLTLMKEQAVSYLLREKFITTASAPLTTPRTCEPGPGTLTFVDTNNRMSIADGKLTINGAPAANDRAVSTLQTRASGRFFSWVVPSRATVGTTMYLGAASSQTGASQQIGILYVNATNVQVISGTATVISSIAIGANEHCFMSLLRPTAGGFLLARNGLTGNYKILWAYDDDTATNCFKSILSNTTAVNYQLDNIYAGELSGSQFQGDWSLATSRTASPVTGQIGTQIANAILEFAWTAGAAEVVDFMFRRVDDNNTWIVRCNQAGSRIYLYKKAAGVETEYGAVGGAAQTFTAGTVYRIVVKMDNAQIDIYVENQTSTVVTSPLTYASGTFQQTSTSVKVTGFATGANLTAWPLEVALPFPFDYSYPESTALARVSKQTLWSTSGSQDWLGRPKLLDLGTGVWIVVYRSGSQHTPEVGARLHIRFTDDEGVTWSDEDKTLAGASVTGFPVAPQVGGKSVVEPGPLMMAPNGNLLLHAFERAGGGTTQWRSTNSGATWTSEGTINSDTTLVSSDDHKVIGTDIYIVARIDPGSDFVHPHYVALYKSTNNGSTWTKVADIEASLDCNETGLLWLGGNNLDAIVRDPTSVQTFLYQSTNLGVAWGARQTITSQVGIVQKPACRTIDGYEYLFGRDARTPQKTVVYRRQVGQMAWEPRFYPDTIGYEDTGYCDMLQRTNGDFYMLSYFGTTTEASIIEYVFREL